jgi:integral membrane protein (TIGR01906 family)
MPHASAIPLRLQRVFQAALVCLIPIVLVLGAVRVLVMDQYLAFEYAKASFPLDPFGFSPAQRLAYASANFRFVRQAQPLSALAEQQLDGHPAYNTRELEHMQDVQRVYQASASTWPLALILALLLSFSLGWRAETRPALATATKLGGLISAGLVGAIGLLALIAWQVWFVAFHQVFFAAGTWSFDYSDTLIRLFPERFWLDAALTITGLSFAGGLVVAALGIWFLQRTAHASTPLRLMLPPTASNSIGD